MAAIVVLHRHWRALLVTAVWAGLACLHTAGAQQRGFLEPLGTDGGLTFFIDTGTPASGFREGDRELCGWALDAWAAASDGILRFREAPGDEALVRIHFVEPSFGQYGEMRPLEVGGRRGAAVYIRPDTDALGPDIGRMARQDPLMRDTIVYMTCLHELGHALGLVHTAEFEDIMYFFGYGGDIPAFFGRYRDELETREDFELHSGLSDGDLAQLRGLYAGR